MGKPVAHVAGFAYSDALKSHGGTWDWETISQWLKSPRDFAPGTTMTFAGLSKPEDRATVMASLNSISGRPIPVPPPPAVDTPAPVAATGAHPAAPPGKAEHAAGIHEAKDQQPEGN